MHRKHRRFVSQEPLLKRRAAWSREMSNDAVCSHDAMTRDDERKSIARHHGTDGPRGAWLAGQACQLRVRSRFTCGNVAAMSSDRLLEYGPPRLVKFHVQEV